MTSRPTIIVCTRDRPASLAHCLDSVIAAWQGDTELIIVDQSRDGRTMSIVKRLKANGEIRYLRSSGTGLSLARNEGAKAAAGDLLLFTDDDCRVDPAWVSTWLTAFDRSQQMGVGFGRVTSPPVDNRHGFIPIFQPDDDNLIHGRELFRRGVGAVGIGANLVIRRAVWAQVAGFDEALGAGASFPGAEEVDIAYRIVCAGWGLGHVTGAPIKHYGYRPGSDASRLVRAYMAATAAMYVKHLRCGDRFAAEMLLRHGFDLLAVCVRACVTRSRPTGLNSLVAYWRGAARAYRQPLDRRRRLYRENRAAPQASAQRGTLVTPPG